MRFQNICIAVLALSMLPLYPSETDSKAAPSFSDLVRKLPVASSKPIRFWGLYFDAQSNVHIDRQITIQEAQAIIAELEKLTYETAPVVEEPLMTGCNLILQIGSSNTDALIFRNDLVTVIIAGAKYGFHLTTSDYVQKIGPIVQKMFDLHKGGNNAGNEGQKADKEK